MERGQGSGGGLIAALYVERGGFYWDRDDVDPWDEERDARNYTGPHPVVAHPPCSRWCQLAHINQKRYGHRVGEDGGCFSAALMAVRTWGGVLEHPAFSYAWPAYGLPAPRRGGWIKTLGDPGWVTEVSQVAYGHPARKRTWLYAITGSPPPLDWSEPEPTAQVSWCANHGDSPLPRVGKKKAAATPPQFGELLLSIAKSVNL